MTFDGFHFVVSTKSSPNPTFLVTSNIVLYCRSSALSTELIMGWVLCLIECVFHQFCDLFLIRDLILYAAGLIHVLVDGLGVVWRISAWLLANFEPIPKRIKFYLIWLTLLLTHRFFLTGSLFIYLWLNRARCTNKTSLIAWCNAVHQQTNRTNK